VELGLRLSRRKSRAFCESCPITLYFPASVEHIGEWSFFECKSLASITFELGPRLSQVESKEFRMSCLTPFHLPASAEFLDEWCFSGYPSIPSVMIESDSWLSRLESNAFCRSCFASLHCVHHLNLLTNGVFLAASRLVRLHLNGIHDYCDLKAFYLRGCSCVVKLPAWGLANHIICAWGILLTNAVIKRDSKSFSQRLAWKSLLPPRK
jgi:hypothetical protein